ncbi:probable disease resistance protein RPP1 [Raphanus sativus]|uniref:ADP-ribosyl cyclase/cyclic ADP-ribose hydrolase n=1 Tax=Raphanus sativus TaxID=3726 RepID=A0A6J0LHV7_RAPSA|nr:probable disease resistance protein RPP1 [Raphanus sativus]
MASSSSSLTLLAPPSSLPRNWIHHVFPSFHGADVRTNFLSHVLKELKSKAIDVFIDNDIERSKLIGPALVEAIRGSRIAIVLLSKNYASSTWCLNELVEIMKCREEFGETVIPLFYEVDPTDVKKQTGDFGTVFLKTCEEKTEEEIQRWKHALSEVAQLAGYHSTNWKNEAEMIEAIATKVSNKLNLSAPSNDSDNIVGMESNMTEIRRLLQLGSDESVRKIGILGQSGIGKTTIARYIFNQCSQDFQTSAFIGNIRRNYAMPAYSDKHSVKLYLEEKFMSQVTNEKDIKVPHLGVAKDRLKGKKVLLVLDDVDHSIQVETMANETCVGPGSLIIITTQDQGVLKASGIDHIHKMDLPSYDEALQIFCINAFGQKYPKDGFEELAWNIRDLVGRLPLGLEVMGSYFRGMSEQEWTEALPNLRAHLDRNGEIANILKFSYDALCDKDKRLFLHIACFFDGEVVDVVEACIKKSFLDVTQGLRVLFQKSLINTEFGKMRMPKLLIQLGREIVRQEYPTKPRKRQFLNDAKDIEDVLGDDNAGNNSVIGIDFDHNQEITCQRAFERFSNLQFLTIDGKGINPRSMNYMSRNLKLKVLNWSFFQIPCFPSSFNPEFLVKLDMSFSCLTKLWKGNKPLNNLQLMHLHYSERLKELPDLSTATNLHDLDLSRCSSLMELPSSIGNAINLRFLDLSHCSSLVKLPFSLGNAINLQKLILVDCPSLVKLHSSIGNAINLEKLDLDDCSSLVELPSSIGNAINLEELDLRNCSSLVKLPASMRNLGRLWYLRLYRCSKLEVNLANINLESLQELNLKGCFSLKSYPESSTDIQELDSWRGRIGRIVLSGMKKPLSLLPLLVGEHVSDSLLLKSDHESSTDIQELVDPWIGRISRLECLKLNEMKKLVSLPPLPDSLLKLNAENCESLERLDCSFGNPDISLNFANCYKLNKEARDLIIHTQTNQYAVFPAEEVPLCFTHRSPGSSITVKLNQKPVGKSAKFKACISLCASADEGEEESGKIRYWGSICCSITSGGNSLTYCKKQVEGVLPGNLCTFEVEVETEDITSTELLFDFELLYSASTKWKIKECGILPLIEVPLLRFRDVHADFREDDGVKRQRLF